jgi:hypothetical protein
MSRCKAAEILRNKAYLEGMSLTKDDLSGVALAKTEANAADGRLPGHSF